MDSIIKIENLSKRFRVYDKPLDRLKEWLTPHGMSYHWAFWALQNINLEVKSGAALGIVGANGAGKSTLLKILCGTLSPTSGSIEANGRITGLLELGSGFHPEFTGRQNIFLNARLLGLSDSEIQEKLSEIISFAEIDDFIDHPIRIYSTGMVLRLGFSIAANVDPDILVIDEALAVGDAYFQQKCLRHLKKFRENNGTLIFVSHDPGAVKLLCDEAILLHEHQIVESGNPEDVLNYYNALIARHVSDTASFRIEKKQSNIKQPATQRSGTFDALLTKIDVLFKNSPTRTVVSGDEININVEAIALSDIEKPTVGISIRDRLGYEVFATNTYILEKRLPDLNAGDRLNVSFVIPMNIGTGNYTITAAIHTGRDHLDKCFDWADKFIAFKILPETKMQCSGVARLPVTVESNISKTDLNEPTELLSSIFGDAPDKINLNDDSSSWLFSGWHPIEQLGDDAVCWSKPSGIFILKSGTKLFVELSTEPSQCDGFPLKLQLLANGKLVANYEVLKPDWQKAEFEIPAEFIGKVTRFSLQSKEAFIPAKVYGTNDQRELGVMVKKIWAE